MYGLEGLDTHGLGLEASDLVSVLRQVVLILVLEKSLVYSTACKAYNISNHK